MTSIVLVHVGWVAERELFDQPRSRPAGDQPQLHTAQTEAARQPEVIQILSPTKNEGFVFWWDSFQFLTPQCE